MEPDVSQNLSVHSLHYMDFLPQNKQADLQDIQLLVRASSRGQCGTMDGKTGAEVKRKEKQPMSDSSTQAIKAASEPQRQ